jgi:glutathione S-transferase
LNYKGLPYKTVWVELCDVAALYASHNAAPSNDSPSAAPHERCTVPALYDPNTGKFVSDSFKISKYLDETYPEKPLFPRGSLGLQYTFDQITVPELTIMVSFVYSTFYLSVFFPFCDPLPFYLRFLLFTPN